MPCFKASWNSLDMTGRAITFAITQRKYFLKSFIINDMYGE